MKPQQLPASLVSILIWVAVIAWVAFEFATGYQHSNAALLVLSIAIVGLGELVEIDLPGGRSTPVSIAVTFALFVILPPVEVVAAIVPALVAHMFVKHKQLGWGPVFRSTSRRLASTLVALAAYVWLSASLIPFDVEPPERGILLTQTLAMVIAGALKLVADTGMSAAFIASSQRIPAGPIWRGQLQNRIALHTSFVSVAALMALSFQVLNWVAFVLFLLPLLAARTSFSRYADIHKTYAQTIRGLSKVPELARYAEPGHSVRVAGVAMALARDFGFSDSEVQEVEFAALLHDVGRVSLGDPLDLPESVAGTSEARRLAHASAAIISKTPYLDQVARIVRHQGDRFSDTSDFDPDAVMLGSRMLKVANDFVELTEEGPKLAPEIALDQLESRAGADYDPALINSLRRVLELQPHL